MYHQYEHVIYVRDNNVTLNHELDTCGYLYVNNPNSREYVKSCIVTNQLTDIWRERNKSTRAYTFDKKQTTNGTKA